MKIICDTNIWYDIGNSKIETKNLPIENKLTAVFTNIDEFTKTTYLIRNEDYTRNGIQAMFKFSGKHAIFEPPLIHLIKLDDPNFEYDIRKKHNDILNFSELIAKGYKISDIDGFTDYCIERNKHFKHITEFTNSTALKIKAKIKNIKQHRKIESIQIIRDFISSILLCQSKKLSKKFNWEKIELLENTLKVYFTKLETGEIISKENDWYDIFILAYVQKSDKIWTNDSKLINFIKDASMEKYLFNNEINNNEII